MTATKEEMEKAFEIIKKACASDNPEDLNKLAEAVDEEIKKRK